MKAECREKVLLLKKEDGVATIILNRPKRMNALNPRLITQLNKALERSAKDGAIRALIVTGNGKAFCSGGDVKGHPAFTTPDPMVRREFIRNSQEIILRIQRMKKPVIAAINGFAGGAGLDLALACDMRIGCEESRFSELFIKVGLMPDMGSTYFLSRLIGMAKALEMLLTGDTIDASEALRLGLINRIVPKAGLLKEAKSLANRLGNGPTLAYGFVKSAVYKGWGVSLEDALENERYRKSLLIGTEDVREAVKAFSEKRSPIFKGR
jgi:2-(1,2-epoxy-1,2-dihydrophenyl)acetyl-CoA isomerase